MIAPDTTHIQTERLQRRSASLIYTLPISVSGLMVPSQQILDAVALESYSMRHLQGLNIPFPPRQSNFTQLHCRDHSPPLGSWMVPPTLLHLPIHVLGSLYKLPVLPHPPELCLLPPIPECFADNLVLYRCLSDMAQLSFHWIPGHRDVCPHEIANLLAKTGNSIHSSSLPHG